MTEASAGCEDQCAEPVRMEGESVAGKSSSASVSIKRGETGRKWRKGWEWRVLEDGDERRSASSGEREGRK